jgi:hypothetical protein
MSALPESGSSSERPGISKFDRLVVRNSLMNPHDLQFKIIPYAVGEGYAPYSEKYIAERIRLGGEKIPPETYSELVGDVAEQMLDDKFQHHATHFLLFGESDAVNSKEFAATSRFVKETSRRYTGLPNLESVRLVTPDKDDKWNSVIKKDSKYGELSRVVVPMGFRKQGFTTEIIQEMIDGENGVIEIAMREGIEYVLMVAQNRFSKYIEQTKLEIVDKIPVTLRRAGRRVGRKYPGYWHDEDDKPKLIVTKVPQKQTA